MPAFNPHKDCPGYTAAVVRENNLRDAAFVDGATFICGVPVVDVTVDRFLLLSAVDCPFLYENPTIFPEQIIQTLWILSPQFCVSKWRRWLFTRKHRKISYAKSCAELEIYFEKATYDMPSGSGGGKSYTSWVASVVDAIAGEYGWSEKIILHEIPLRRLFQYFRAIQRRNSDRPMINPSEKYISLWLKKRNEENRLKKFEEGAN